MPTSKSQLPLPRPFEKAVATISGFAWRPELQVEEIPAPQRIAPFSVALTADVLVDSDELGNGRLVLLHDPAGNDAWQGTFRLVSYVRAEIEPEMVTDPLLANVGWSWLTDALSAHGAELLAPSGTVTSVNSETFGAMEDDPGRAELEVRASWTPVLGPDGSGIDVHLAAWSDLLCTVAGVPPVPDGVLVMPSRRAGGARRGR
ncbi:hypothetical protein CGZ93_08570 [Enemella dayhoffiae]|uniref:DUF3000 domain-containing protein n=1 Tax=Enemella dayhoffiae TaxID=2016507 RepID=A0A255H2T9_9ACTN|nr:DUF3000 domain-containing protein [Enemella dayhoffiae]OYO21975.1 hypothetical protein CGZ93_08570 [Enemella dayhoffiae]